MTAVISLGMFAAVLGTLGGRALSTAAWLKGAPRLAIVTWQAMSVAVVTSVLLAGAALAVPMLPMALAGDLAAFIGACSVALREQYATPGGAATSLAGVILVVAVATRLCHKSVTGVVSVRRARRRQVHALTVIGEPVAAFPGVRLVRDSRPLVYCLPGRRGGVVVTTGAMDRLPGRQLGAVLAHERAHLRGRHQLVQLSTNVLAEAFGFVPLFRAARAQVPALLEMAADDSAVRGGGRGALARALVTLAEGGTPAGALAAGGPSSLARVVRLTEPPPPIGRGAAGLLMAGLLVVLSAPVGIVAAPAITAAAMDYCPVLFPS